MVVVLTRSADVADIEKVQVLRVEQRLHEIFAVSIGIAQRKRLVEWDAQRPDSMDESVLFDIRDPFQNDSYRPQLAKVDGAEVQSSLASCGTAVDSGRLAHFQGHGAYQTDKLQRHSRAKSEGPAFGE